MTDDDLSEDVEQFSRMNINVSQEQEKVGHPPAVDMKAFEESFVKLSVSSGKNITLTALESIVSDMKDNNVESISLATLLQKLHEASNSVGKKTESGDDDITPNELKPESSSNKYHKKKDVQEEPNVPETGHNSLKEVYVEDVSDDDSISSSVNSSWIESPKGNSPKVSFQFSPPKGNFVANSSTPNVFNFKTPKKYNKAAAEGKPPTASTTGDDNGTDSPGIIVDNSPPPTSLNGDGSSVLSGSVFGPSDEELKPNKKNNENNGKPIARTLFKSAEENSFAKDCDKSASGTNLSSSLFSGKVPPNVTFGIGKSSDKRGQKAKKSSRNRGKSQISQNLPTANFNAFRQGPVSDQPPPPPDMLFSAFPPKPPEEQNIPSTSPMEMDQSPVDTAQENLNCSQTVKLNNSFKFSVGSGTATSSSKLKSGVKAANRKSRRGKNATTTSPAEISPVKMNLDPTNLTSPIQKQSKEYSESPDNVPQSGDFEEVDSRMIALAELFKKEGKQLYASERYDMAYDAFSKALKAAPVNWKDSANVLSNRAASLMMMERIIEAVTDCEESAALDPTFLKVHSRRGRALLKLGRIEEAKAAFQHVISAPVSHTESFYNSQDESTDYAGRNLARAGMKQIVLANSLIASLDRLLDNHFGNLESSDTNPSTKVYMKTSEELLALCPFMRSAQVHKARALALGHNWLDLKEFIEMCVISVHHTMQELDAHPLARLPLDESAYEDLKWFEEDDEPGSVSINGVILKNMFLAMGPYMSVWYVVALKNQSLSRTCSSSIMRTLVDVLSDLRVNIEGAEKMDSLLNGDINKYDSEWSWLMPEVTKITNILSLKQVADEKFRLGKYAESLKSYGAVLQVDPDALVWNAIMFSNRAAASMHLRLYSDAVSDCHQSLARDPQYPRAYLRRARAQRELGHYAASIRDFKKYLKISPQALDRMEVQIELEETNNAKIEEELLAAARKRREQAGTRQRESGEEFRRRARAHDANQKRCFKEYPGDRDRENFSNQQRKDSHHKSPKSSSTKASTATIQPDVDSENLYTRLGVSSKANEKEIKSAYRKMALKYHPDKNKDESSTEIFKKLTEAYSTLSDSSSRRDYDRTLPLHRSGSGRSGKGRRYGGWY